MPFPSINAGGLECLSWLGLSYGLWREKKITGGRERREEWRMKRLNRKGAREGQDGTGVWQQSKRRAIPLIGQWILQV